MVIYSAIRITTITIAPIRFNLSISNNPFIKIHNMIILYIIDFIYLVISAFKYIFTKKTLLFEKISKTKLVSTIKSN